MPPRRPAAAHVWPQPLRLGARKATPRAVLVLNNAVAGLRSSFKTGKALYRDLTLVIEHIHDLRKQTRPKTDKAWGRVLRRRVSLMGGVCPPPSFFATVSPMSSGCLKRITPVLVDKP